LGIRKKAREQAALALAKITPMSLRSQLIIFGYAMTLRGWHFLEEKGCCATPSLALEATRRFLQLCLYNRAYERAAPRLFSGQTALRMIS
jgi:hypothetical protein